MNNFLVQTAPGRPQAGMLAQALAAVSHHHQGDIVLYASSLKLVQELAQPLVEEGHRSRITASLAEEGACRDFQVSRIFLLFLRFVVGVDKVLRHIPGREQGWELDV